MPMHKFQPNEEQRRMVKALAGYGVKQRQIAALALGLPALTEQGCMPGGSIETRSREYEAIKGQFETLEKQAEQIRSELREKDRQQRERECWAGSFPAPSPVASGARISQARRTGRMQQENVSNQKSPIVRPSLRAQSRWKVPAPGGRIWPL